MQYIYFQSYLFLKGPDRINSIKCFRVVDVGPPKKPIRRQNADGNLSLVQRLLLYDFLEERDGQLVLPLDFVELLDLYSDTDEITDEEDI